MKKIYIGMKFNRDKTKQSLEEQLKNDLRALLLEDVSLLIQPTHATIPNTELIYNGPFYCESAGEQGDVTCTDCNQIVAEELKALDDSDLFLCYLDDTFSTGSIVELMYCATKGIPTIVLYKNQTTKYNINSEYWFALTAAKQLNPHLQLVEVQDGLTIDGLRKAITIINVTYLYTTQVTPFL